MVAQLSIAAGIWSSVTRQLAVTYLGLLSCTGIIYLIILGGKKRKNFSPWPQIPTPIKTHQCTKSQGYKPTVKYFTHTKTLQKHNRIQFQDRLYTAFTICSSVSNHECMCMHVHMVCLSECVLMWVSVSICSPLPHTLLISDLNVSLILPPACRQAGPTMIVLIWQG